ncbi:BPSS1780 family membrane protein [Neisseria shayeganii]|uniref:Brp/Blh family beta-carotene 15,15'-monooxygenase n=1 Tax=Neisseria shayeganii 871 TaxID=1032488 RepID=G4CF50_9NEIS|nr:BPSS1780 family membrane protein [Neisseria shayeganii]EGY53588.1 brp/Blh family beta-carotene 15,15'-monooxygenase [Neisseria shayeganii 871]
MYDVYRAPESGGEPEDSGELSLLATPNRCPAATGWAWIPQAFSIFRERWGMWLLIGLIALLCNFAVSVVIGLVPEKMAWLVQIFSFIFSLFLMCGIVYCAASQVENGELEISGLFAGFQLKFKEVLILGVLQFLLILGLLLAVAVPTVLLLGVSFNLASLNQNWGGLLFALILVGLVVGVGVILFTWFTPPLVMLHNISPTRAIGMSLRGGLANLLPLLVYVLALIGLAIAFGLLAALLGSILPQSVALALMVLIGIPVTLFFSVWNGIISYVSYLSVWTNAELES